MDEFELTSSWTEVFDGSVDNCVLQVDGSCSMAIQSATPDETTPEIKLRAEGSGSEFAGSGLTGVSIWLKETSGDSSVRAVVASW
jgi:hypothetical protein